jgi:peptidoglycan hydrolase-like protein with peptidoglycan-binding domain
MGLFKSFSEMVGLTLLNHRKPNQPFKHSKLLAIFWEETLFGNIKQIGGGRGVGFGQVERQNFFFLKQQPAFANGYQVPSVKTTDTAVDDNIAVQVASCLLLHYFFTSKNPTGAEQFANESYSGANLPAAQLAQFPPGLNTRADRLAIIDRWNNCSAALDALPGVIGTQPVPAQNYVGDVEDKILTALRLARDFADTAPDQGTPGITIRRRLFPQYWHFPPELKAQLTMFFNSAALLAFGATGPMVRVLQAMLNSYPVPDFMVSTDGFFGAQTKAAVEAFQQWCEIAVDGIVGPQTKGQLKP